MPRYFDRYFQGASLLALVLAAPAAAFAQDQDPPTTVDAVVSIGTRDVEGIDIDRIGGSLSVIGAEAMEDRQVRAVAEVLRDVPGVAVSRAGAPGSLTQVRIRGAEANHTLNLFDGIEVNDPFQGEFEYATLLADDLARVEVLRGQQSALYGSDAIGGVVSYVTATGGEASGLRVRAEGGSFETFGGAIRYGARRGDLDYVISAAGQDSGGYATATGGGTRDTGQAVYSLGGKVAWRASDALKLRAVVRATRSNADLNNAPFPDYLVVDSPGTGYQAQNLYWLAAADYEAMDGLWSHSLSIQGVEAWRDYFNASEFQPFVRDSRVEGTRRKASYVTTFRIEGEALTHSLTGAVDYEEETFDQPVNPFGAPLLGRESTNTGFVADYRADFARGSGFGAAVRHDKNDRFADVTTWRVQAYHQLTERVRIRAAAGTGVKAPNHFELFGFGFGFQGNPTLEPEESSGWEAGADFTFRDETARLGFTWFDATLENEIFSWFGGPLPVGCPVPAPGLNTSCNRVAESSQQGLELYAHLEAEQAGLTFDASYTWLDAEEEGFQEIRRAPHIASASLSWRSPGERFGATLMVRYTGAQQDSNFSSLTPGMFPDDPEFTPLPSPPNPFGRVELPAYAVVNVAADWKVSERVELFGRIENLFDKDYYEVITFPSQPLGAYVGVRARY